MVKLENIKKKKEVKDTQLLEKFGKVLNRDIKLFNNGLNDKRKHYFYIQLETLIHAKIDIGNALKLIVETTSKKNGQETFAAAYNNVLRGDSLSSSLQKTGKFSPYEIFSVQIGEETGRLENVIKEIAVFFGKKIKQRRNLINALTYPVIVLFVAFGSVLFMMNVVVPMFADVFKRFGNELPLITRTIILMSDFFIKGLPYFFIVIAAGSFFLWQSRKKHWFKKWTAIVILKTPVVGKLVQKIYLARFCTALGLLMDAKIPLVKALRLVKEMIELYPISITLDLIEKDILGGKSLHSSMAAFGIYDKKMIALIKVAEEVNKLDEMFNDIARNYSEETEHEISILNSLLEPFLIVFLGLIVGIILVGMYLPLFQLGVNVK